MRARSWCFWVLLLASCTKDQATSAPPETKKSEPTPIIPAAPRGHRITRASGVRLRQSPDAAAPEVSKLDIGTVVSELESKESWARVRTAEGREGWLLESLTLTYEPARAREITQRILAERKESKSSFADNVDLTKMLARFASTSSSAALTAELELERLRVLARLLEQIPREKAGAPPYVEWIDAQGDTLVYSEPAGQWFVRALLLWDLEKINHRLPIADEIAWDAAAAPLPGECEGYFPCYLSVAAMSYGEYLRRHPNGAHVTDALNSIRDTLNPDNAKELDGEMKQEALSELVRLKERIAVTGARGKETLAAAERIERLLNK
jgi:hypothetical protein